MTYVFCHLIDLFECYDVHMLRKSVFPMYRSISSPPIATPCITFLVSLCIAELRDSVYSICDAVFKEYGKKWGKWIDKLCEKLFVRLQGKFCVWKFVLKKGLKE